MSEENIVKETPKKSKSKLKLNIGFIIFILLVSTGVPLLARVMSSKVDTNSRSLELATLCVISFLISLFTFTIFRNTMIELNNRMENSKRNFMRKHYSTFLLFFIVVVLLTDLQVAFQYIDDLTKAHITFSIMFSVLVQVYLISLLFVGVIRLSLNIKDKFTKKKNLSEEKEKRSE